MNALLAKYCLIHCSICSRYSGVAGNGNLSGIGGQPERRERTTIFGEIVSMLIGCVNTVNITATLCVWEVWFDEAEFFYGC